MGHILFVQYFFVHTAQPNREVNIMPNRLFQGIVNQMREAIDRTIGVVDETGTVIACSELGLIGEVRKGVVVLIMQLTLLSMFLSALNMQYL